MTARDSIERDLLRAAADVIARNNAGVSNWQSWHNAAIGAVGFALDDAALIEKAIEGPGGFHFQMRESVLGDGAWYEGAWGYHFYALDPLCQLAEMAARNGLDLYAAMPLRRMFEAPLRVAMPDFSLPPFNDSAAVNLAASYDRLYEIAWQRYNDPAFAAVPGRRARGREALFWGAASLPESPSPAPASAVYEDSGNAVLRAGADHYLALKFGPHGGWHGHYDKLGFVSYARGAAMAVDPGTQSYAAPTHETWDKVTLAHNTVVVDEKTQAEATGQLLAFAALPSVSAVRASAGPPTSRRGSSAPSSSRPITRWTCSTRAPPMAPNTASTGSTTTTARSPPRSPSSPPPACRKPTATSTSPARAPPRPPPTGRRAST